MIDSIVLAGVLDGHDILHILYHTDRPVVPTNRGTYRTRLRIGYIMACMAINHFLFEACEGIGEGFHLLIGLPQEMQYQSQRRATPYSRQGCHLVDSLL